MNTGAKSHRELNRSSNKSTGTQEYCRAGGSEVDVEKHGDHRRTRTEGIAPPGLPRRLEELEPWRTVRKLEPEEQGGRTLNTYGESDTKGKNK